MARRKPNEEPITTEESAGDRFVRFVREAMEAQLAVEAMDAKERNVLFANCIKFIAVTRKGGGDGDDEDWFKQ